MKQEWFKKYSTMFDLNIRPMIYHAQYSAFSGPYTHKHKRLAVALGDMLILCVFYSIIAITREESERCSHPGN